MVYGLSTIAEIDTNNIITYTHQDTLGSTVLTTDQSGNVVTKYEYDPFGQLIGQDGVSNTNYLYTGQEYDQESDLYYYNARYYNPRLGRFISRDPYLGRDGDSLSRNGYTYVKNNPLKYVDPSGEEEEKSAWDKFISNDYVQGVGGFFVGAGQGLLSTAETVGNAVFHPIDTAVDIGNGVKDLAVNTYDGSKLIYNEISNKGVGGFFDDVGDGVNYYKDQFNNLSSYDKGKTTGFVGEKILETVLITKGVGAVTKATSVEEASNLLKVIDKVPKPKVIDIILQNNYINQLFKDSDSLIGGTATAVRKEISSGLPTKGKFHIEKANNMVKGLGNWVEKNANTAAGSDIMTVKQIVNDLLSALSGK